MQENYTIFFLKITFAYSTGISYAIRYPLSDRTSDALCYPPQGSTP